MLLPTSVYVCASSTEVDLCTYTVIHVMFWSLRRLRSGDLLLPLTRSVALYDYVIRQGKFQMLERDVSSV